MPHPFRSGLPFRSCRPVLTWALILAPLSLTAGKRSDRPNIVFILADDIGYGDVGCYGSTLIRTPAIDRLAATGVRFTQAYAPASTSSPSRYALLTGTYAWRKNVGILPADAPLSIDKHCLTLPRMLQRAGYATGLVGKWHLGLGSAGRPVDFNGRITDGPVDIGFDYAYFFPATNDRVPCIFIENDRVDGARPDDTIRVSYRRKVGHEPTGKEHPEMLTLKPFRGHDGTIVNGVSRIGWMSGGKAALWNDETMGNHLLDKAKAFMAEHREAPFFLYFATHNAHEPRIPSPAFRGRSAAGVYGDVIEEFDHTVDEIVKTLKELDIFENTLLIVTSDNGPMVKEGYDDGALEHIGSHDPFAGLRGTKYSLYEGGTRVPFVASWPRAIRKPFTQEQPFCYLDMLATAAGLTGAPLNDDERNDSRNAAPLFLKRKAKPYRPYILTQNNGRQITIHCGAWKYLPATAARGEELYNLETDRGEKHNVATQHPAVAAKLKAFADEATASAGAR